MTTPDALHRALRQRHQRERAAFAVVVGAQQEEDVFQRDDERQRPEDQRQDAEDFGLVTAPPCCRGARRLAKGVERAGADVAVDDTDAPDGERPESGRGR